MIQYHIYLISSIVIYYLKKGTYNVYRYYLYHFKGVALTDQRQYDK